MRKIKTSTCPLSWKTWREGKNKVLRSSPVFPLQISQYVWKIIEKPILFLYFWFNKITFEKNVEFGILETAPSTVRLISYRRLILKILCTNFSLWKLERSSTFDNFLSYRQTRHSDRSWNGVTFYERRENWKYCVFALWNKLGNALSGSPAKE